MELASNVTEKFTQEMKFSEYSGMEFREVVTSSLLGWRRKINRRKD